MARAAYESPESDAWGCVSLTGGTPKSLWRRPVRDVRSGMTTAPADGVPGVCVYWAANTTLPTPATEACRLARVNGGRVVNVISKLRLGSERRGRWEGGEEIARSRLGGKRLRGLPGTASPGA
jgi:hypothetical protein